MEATGGQREGERRAEQLHHRLPTSYATASAPATVPVAFPIPQSQSQLQTQSVAAFKRLRSNFVALIQAQFSHLPLLSFPPPTAPRCLLVALVASFVCGVTMKYNSGLARQRVKLAPPELATSSYCVVVWQQATCLHFPVGIATTCNGCPWERGKRSDTLYIL